MIPCGFHFQEVLLKILIDVSRLISQLLTHNREYWNASVSVVCRLSVANNFLICRLGSAVLAEFSGRHFFRVKIQLNL